MAWSEAADGGVLGQAGFDTREEAAIMYTDLPGQNYTAGLLAAVMKKTGPTQSSFPGLGRAAEQFGL